MNKCKVPKIPPLLINNKFVINCKEKAKELNTYFSYQCQPLVNNSVLPFLSYITDNRLHNIPITNDDIIALIRGLNPAKANGPDGISGRMLILGDESLVLPIKLIFLNITETGIYPDTWELANVTPIHKKGNKQLVKNYRPIALLPICGKLLEKIIFKNLYNFFDSNYLISKNQSGFRPGDSTVNQLVDFVNEIHKSFDKYESLETRAVFLDISKAVDKVWHEGLIFKLKQNGVTGSVINLLTNYLTNRKQCVVLNGSSSEFLPIKSGVPQGSVLGPLLFLIYINDLEVNLKSKTKFFADDTMLFSIVRDPFISALELNHDLKLINNWAHQWKMSFNPEPNKQAVEVLFSIKNKSPIHPPIFFNGIEITRVDEHKHLGLILDPKLTFVKHIISKIKIARRNIGILKQLSTYLPLTTLDQMYKIFIRSHLDYCDIIFHVPPLNNCFDYSVTLNTTMEMIEKTQYQAA